MSESEEPVVGSLAEEAAKLFGALSGLADSQGAGLGGAFAGIADKVTGAAHDLDDHLATGECTYCPLCRAIAALRATSPEVKAHLASAGASLLQAAAGVLATVPPTADARPTGVEHIDLDDDQDWDVADPAEEDE